MTTQSNEILIECEADSMSSLKGELELLATRPVNALERRGLDGSVPVWILAATVAVNALPTLMAAVARYIDQGKVTRIQVGDITIENPGKADLELLRALIAQRLDA